MSSARFTSCLLLVVTLPACELVSGLSDLAVDDNLGGGGAPVGGSGGAGAGGSGGTGTGAGNTGGTGASGGEAGGGDGGTGGTACAPGAIGQPCCMDACQSGAVCDAGTCVACGAIGDPCCDGPMACDANRTCGAADVCEGCVTALESGSQHVCAQLTDDTVWCWGINLGGELGQSPSGGQHTTPLQIAGLATQTDVLEASSTTCAIRNDGTMACWGDNSYGQVGDGTSVTEHPTLGEVTTLGNTVTAVGAFSGHMCATSGGSVYCWGANDYGELGINLGDGMSYNLPQLVTAVPDPLVSYTGGFFHTCGVSDQGAVWCWGKSDSGVLGFPPMDFFSYPPGIAVGLDSGVAKIAGGLAHNCAVKTDKTLWCWGENLSGELGDPMFSGGYRITPTQVVALGTEVEEVSAGYGHNCVVRSGGTVWCWGANNEAQLGFGNADLQEHPIPLEISLPALAQDVALGYASSCAHLVDGRVLCWGRNLFGQSGVGGDPMFNPNEIQFQCP